LVNEAAQRVQGVRLLEALANVEEAERIQGDLFVVQNLKGAVFTKMRIFDRARQAFQRAVELNPKSQQPRFNLAELDFVSHEWASAAKQFESLVASANDPITRRLMEFKLVICYLKLDQKEKALALLKKFHYLDDDPAYYLGHAAVEFQKGSREEANGWINSAQRVFSSDRNLMEVYLDAFVEADWIETLTK
jgi:tetratricopeptide (TPR) repeat protein